MKTLVKYFSESEKLVSLETYIKEELIKNDFNEKWEKLNSDHEAYKLIESAIKGFDETSRFSLDWVAEASYDSPEGTDNYYVAAIYGGLNGSGEWTNYFEDLKNVFEKIGHTWVIDLVNDCLDDVFDLKFGFTLKDEKSK